MPPKISAWFRPSIKRQPPCLVIQNSLALNLHHLQTVLAILRSFADPGMHLAAHLRLLTFQKVHSTVSFHHGDH
ncbi:hypothetical protein C8R43DRAFT_1134656 [Mycena crocata]|nr:hypothetical protein C8R43DRAFT_1134656 [Mycena crocata]